MAQGLDNPAKPPLGDTLPRHILDSINISTDLQKKRKKKKKKKKGNIGCANAAPFILVTL